MGCKVLSPGMQIEREEQQPEEETGTRRLFMKMKVTQVKIDSLKDLASLNHHQWGCCLAHCKVLCMMLDWCTSGC